MEQSKTPKWNFPSNNYTGENGLDTSDMETFRKDPMASLAREICQNSIDAVLSNDLPVRVEFSLFSTPRVFIPGINELALEIDRCYEYKKDSQKEKQALAALRKNVHMDTITCLRISDFNTKGVTGVEKNEIGTDFFNLTKGSGVSDKGASSGGSKGIGKFASFVVSGTNTVFYSTRTFDGHYGYLGISRLRSVPIDENDPELLTMGTGYFGIGEKNSAVPHELSLDIEFSRAKEESGTDVYLIGFNNDHNWEDEIIVKVLESFMVAILRGKLEVIVNGTLVAKSTVPQILARKDFGKSSMPKTVKDVRAQYALLTDTDVCVSELEIIDGMSVTMYLKKYTSQTASEATKQCIMVRYPYMKIKHITTGVIPPFSAMCIIESNEINESLRRIENPQHTDWEIKRLNDFPEDKKIVSKIYNALKNGIKEFIRLAMQNSASDSTDIVGAGDYLPSQENLGEGRGESQTIATQEKRKPTSIKIVRVREPKTVKAGEDGDSLDWSTGNPDTEGDEGKFPSDEGGAPQPNPYIRPEHDLDDSTTVGAGDLPALKKTELSGMRYRNIVRDKSKGKYICSFSSLYDEQNCELQIRLCGEGKDKFPLDILEASINGVACEVKEGKVINFSIKKNEIYRVDYRINRSELFSSEVIVNAYR